MTRISLLGGNRKSKEVFEAMQDWPVCKHGKRFDPEYIGRLTFPGKQIRGCWRCRNLCGEVVTFRGFVLGAGMVASSLAYGLVSVVGPAVWPNIFGFIAKHPMATMGLAGSVMAVTCILTAASLEY